MLQKPKILVVVGPTASGKSDLAVHLAKKFGGEVISADSRQVYKGLNIGTGKVTKKEMAGIPHLLLDVVSPAKQYSVAEYQRDANAAIANIVRIGKLPIICGGTVQYIDALICNISLPEVAPNKELRTRLEKLPVEKLFLMLQKLDSVRAENIDAKNPRRLIRAIEIAKALGHVPHLDTGCPSAYDSLFIGINVENEKLKINQDID